MPAMKRINANCVQVNSDRKSAWRVPRRENPNPVYFYYTRSSAEPERGEPEGVLRSIVKLMACLQPGEAVLDPVLELRCWSSRRGRMHRLDRTAQPLLTTIVIDALDQCDPRRRLELFDALSVILRTSTSLIKIFVDLRSYLRRQGHQSLSRRVHQSRHRRQ